MSQVAEMHAGSAVEPAESPLTPESWGKLGMWIFLAGDAVGFGTLLAAYGVMRATSNDWPNPVTPRWVAGTSLTPARKASVCGCPSRTVTIGRARPAGSSASRIQVPAWP